MSCELVIGLVTESKPGFAKVRFPDYDDVVSDWLPVIKTRAMNDDENWPLEKEEQVACTMNMYEGSMGDTGVIHGAISSDVDVPDADAGAGKWRKKFNDGGFIEYDKNTHKYSVTVGNDGEIILNGGSNGGLTITPELKDQLDKTNALLAHLVAVINGTPVPEPGSGANSALQIALKSAIAADTLGDFSNIENAKVKH